MTNTRRILLCILDGLGLNPEKRGNAVALAKKPNIDRLFGQYPWSTLVTCGEAVGLPKGQMGNSEVGHLNIGAGRVVEQWLLRITRTLESGKFAENPSYRNFIKSIDKNKPLHLIGLYSDGGVHSHREHFHLLLEQLTQDITTPIKLHLITDGRDVSPHSAGTQIKELESILSKFPQVSVATISGRFYSMDRDKRWERVKRGYDVIVKAKPESTLSPIEYIEDCYKKETTDEFIEPASFDHYDGVQPGESVLFWNFRADRMREIVAALTQEDFSGFERSSVPFNKSLALTFTQYDATYKVPYVFETLEIHNHLGELVAAEGMTQLRVAETEKYPHVTYFFNGGREEPYQGEERALVPSPRDVKTYDEKPQMSAREVTDIVLEAINKNKFNLIVLNYANCDMVGHTGSLEAATKAVETVDTCLGKLIEAIERNNWESIIIADHGNAEQMINYENGTPHTAHTTYPVPIIAVCPSRKVTVSEGGALCDVAPSILTLFGIEQPKEMTGRSLIKIS